MYNTDSETSNYKLIISIDWADEKHDLAIYNNSEIEDLEISNNPKEMHEHFLNFCEENNWQKVAVIIEKNNNLIMSVLESIELIDLYTVHPTTASSYRETFSPSGAKNDISDARSILDLFLKHPEKIRKQRVHQSTDLLSKYTEKRRQIVDDRKSIGNQLTAALKKSHPVVLDIFKSSPISSPVVIDFIEEWPSTVSLKSVASSTVKKFLTKRRCKGTLLETRLELIKSTVSFINDDYQDFYILEITTLVQRIKNLNAIIAQYDQKIKEIFTQNKDFELFNSLPGAGAALAPRLMAFFGNDRDRFSTVGEALLVSEIAPVTIKSGKSKIVRRRFLCNKFLQQTFVEFANGSLQKSAWAKAYYDAAKKNGTTHHTVLRSLAFKWIRIIYACWKKGVLYDEDFYIEQLRKKGSKIVNNLQVA